MLFGTHVTSIYRVHFYIQYKCVFVCIGQVPVYGFSVTALDAGLLSTLVRSQTTLSWFLKTPDGSSAAGIGVILPYSSTG